MRLGTLTQKVKELEAQISNNQSGDVSNSLEILRIFADAHADSLGIEGAFSVYLSDKATGIEVLFSEGQLDEAGLDTSELRGYVNGVKLAQESSLDGQIFDTFATNAQIAEEHLKANEDYQARTTLRYTQGLAEGVKLALNSPPDETFEYIPEESLVRVGGRQERLMTKQNQLLGYLFAHQRDVLTPKQISKGAWGEEKSKGNFGYHMLKLQRLLQPDPDKPQYIQNLHGRGWRFSTNPEDLRHYQVEYDPEKGTVNLSGVTVRLRGKEKQVMDFLYAHVNEPCTPEGIVKAVWGEGRDISVLRVSMATLRTRLSLDEMASPIYGSPGQGGYTLKISQK